MRSMKDRLAWWWLGSILTQHELEMDALQTELTDLKEQMAILSLTVATSRTTASIVQKSDLVLGVDPHLGKM